MLIASGQIDREGVDELFKGKKLQRVKSSVGNSAAEAKKKHANTSSPKGGAEESKA